MINLNLKNFQHNAEPHTFSFSSKTKKTMLLLLTKAKNKAFLLKKV